MRCAPPDGPLLPPATPEEKVALIACSCPNHASCALDAGNVLETKKRIPYDSLNNIELSFMKNTLFVLNTYPCILSITTACFFHVTSLSRHGIFFLFNQSDREYLLKPHYLL